MYVLYYVCLFACMQVRKYACMYACMHVCTNVCMVGRYARVCACTHVEAHTYMHTYYIHVCVKAKIYKRCDMCAQPLEAFIKAGLTRIHARLWLLTCLYTFLYQCVTYTQYADGQTCIHASNATIQL